MRHDLLDIIQDLWKKDAKTRLNDNFLQQFAGWSDDAMEDATLLKDMHEKLNLIGCETSPKYNKEYKDMSLGDVYTRINLLTIITDNLYLFDHSELERFVIDNSIIDAYYLLNENLIHYVKFMLTFLEDIYGYIMCDINGVSGKELEDLIVSNKEICSEEMKDINKVYKVLKQNYENVLKEEDKTKYQESLVETVIDAYQIAKNSITAHLEKMKENKLTL